MMQAVKEPYRAVVALPPVGDRLTPDNLESVLERVKGDAETRREMERIIKFAQRMEKRAKDWETRYEAQRDTNEDLEGRLKIAEGVNADNDRRFGEMVKALKTHDGVEDARAAYRKILVAVGVACGAMIVSAIMVWVATGVVG
jgi:hypothetical protein